MSPVCSATLFCCRQRTQSAQWKIVDAAKPAPDLYLMACRRLSIVPELAVAFEDSPAGARAALDAGLTVVGVNPDPDVQLPAHFRLTDLTQVSSCAAGSADQPNVIHT